MKTEKIMEEINLAEKQRRRMLKKLQENIKKLNHHDMEFSGGGRNNIMPLFKTDTKKAFTFRIINGLVKVEILKENLTTSSWPLEDTQMAIHEEVLRTLPGFINEYLQFFEKKHPEDLVSRQQLTDINHFIANGR